MKSSHKKDYTTLWEDKIDKSIIFVGGGFLFGGLTFGIYGAVVGTIIGWGYFLSLK